MALGWSSIVEAEDYHTGSSYRHGPSITLNPPALLTKDTCCVHMRGLLLVSFCNQSCFLRPKFCLSFLTTMAASSGAIVVDPFCYRQFSEEESSKGYSGTVFSNSIEEFTLIVNERYDESKLKEGYAPFCKHLFIANDFTDAVVNVLPITAENEACLRSKYEARNEKELPVLTRFFPRNLVTSPDHPLPVASYLDLILYSREQINKENASMKREPSEETAPWGIVSIKAQDVDYELPMTPITAMRNALGKEEGGSGISIEREAYMKAYNYWKDHASIA